MSQWLEVDWQHRQQDEPVMSAETVAGLQCLTQNAS